ncbi:MAG: tripartite tricarboxylate transporter substrate binding protein, partial [Betaproteobacteria bacterium]|nr:tripartite tricarboxylate transporter substrate binding protein [Betaproteobacteria bacterium]
VTKLNQEIGRIMKMPDVQNKIEALGADATTSTPGEFTELLRSDIERWAKIIPLLGIQLE